MERWDSIGSTELMQQLYPVYHEWVLFLVTTLKYCVFVCLHRCAYCSIYTHTDGYHSLRWCSKYALFVYVNNACFFFLFFFLIWSTYTKSQQVLSRSLFRVFIWMSIMQGFSKWAQVGEVLQKLWFEIQSRKQAEFTKCDKITTVVGGKYLYGNSRFLQRIGERWRKLAASFCCLFSWIIT